METRKIYGVRHFCNFDQISLIIVERVLPVEWDLLLLLSLLYLAVQLIKAYYACRIQA